jgi:CRISPR-associated protein Cmr6
VSQLPLPRRFHPLLGLSTHGSRSLLYDKGMDRYDAKWGIEAKGRVGFLSSFVDSFASHGSQKEFNEFLKRRQAVLREVGATPREHTTKTRLVVGLGLPSPIETGFLFDRLTGCPYLPGSSVKGLLRASARLVAEGELKAGKTGQAFWSQNRDRIFGPEIAPGIVARKGAATFFDAFPTAWPTLEVDILTPHHQDYYGDSKDEIFPADWDKPGPVPFLAVKAGTLFGFYFKAPEADVSQLAALLPVALDALGIGAKKSAGYGTFDLKGSKPPAKSTITWTGAELSLRQGSVVAERGKLKATCNRSDVSREILDALARHRSLRTDVEVLKLSDGRYRLEEITAWKAR